MFGAQMIHEMDSLQREMDQIFRGLGFNSGTTHCRQKSQFRLHDSGEALLLEAALAGIDSDTLDINILGRRLTLSGEIAAVEVPEHVVWHRQERKAGRFEETIQLPATVDPEQVEAEYQHGILRINLPKAASAMAKKITVKTS